jgi:hypothetical protein
VDLRDYLQSQFHPETEITLIRDSELPSGGLSHSDIRTLYDLGQQLLIPDEFLAEFNKYMPGPPFDALSVEGAEDTSIARTLKLRWLLTGFHQTAIDNVRKHPERHFSIDDNGNLTVIRTLERRIHEFVEYRKYEHKSRTQGRSWRFMIMVDTHLAFTVRDILSLVEMLPPDAHIAPYE